MDSTKILLFFPFGFDGWYSVTVIQWYSDTVIQWYSDTVDQFRCRMYYFGVSVNILIGTGLWCVRFSGLAASMWLVHSCWRGKLWITKSVKDTNEPVGAQCEVMEPLYYVTAVRVYDVSKCVTCSSMMPSFNCKTAYGVFGDLPFVESGWNSYKTMDV